jgi:tetratricopeptide (TPR) repeat protein
MPGGVSNVIHIADSHGDVSIFNDSRRPEIPDQLPLAPYGFTDRTDAIALLNGRLGRGPVRVGIVGLAGTGKSALALHWSNLHPERFPDGRLYIDLRGQEDAEPLTTHQALGHLLDGLGLAEADQPTDPQLRAKRWRTMSAARDLLIILDNAADADQVLPLLSTGKKTVTLITSRDSLAPLAVSAGVELVRLEHLDTEHAVDLLRALIDPERTEGSENDLRELANLCANLPLVLSIAAKSLAASPLTSVGDMCARLREPSRRVDPVRAVFNASLTVLSDGAAQLFRLLGLTPAPEFCLEAVIALSGREHTTVRRGLEQLITANLLAPRRPGWFQMHDLLHAYATELAEHTEHEPALTRLSHWYTETTAKAARSLEAGTAFEDNSPVRGAGQFVDAGAAQNWYVREQASLEVLCRKLAEHGMTAQALSLATQAVDLYAFNNAFGPWFSLARLGADLAAQTVDTASAAWFDEYLGKAFLQSGDSAQARVHLDAALALRRDTADNGGLVRSYNVLGIWHFRQGEFSVAAERFAAALELAPSTPLSNGTDFRALSLLNLGMAVLRQAPATDESDASIALYRQALAHFDTAIDSCDSAQLSLTAIPVLRGRAEALAGLGRVGEAASTAAEAVRIARLLNNALSLAPALASLAEIRGVLGETDAARAALGEAVEILDRLADARAPEYRARLEQFAGPHRR